MSSADFREPSNDELWAQPPAGSSPAAPGQHGLAPIPQQHSLPAPMNVPQPPMPLPGQRPDRTTFVLALVSIALGIPLTAISASTVGLPGLLAVWVGIVAVNFIYSRGQRH